MALPATGATISIGTIRTYFSLSGTQSLQSLGAHISPNVTSNIRLSATFGGWQNPNVWGTSSGVAPHLDEYGSSNY
jgi:hypothetical protein